jgi:hypothetical protein
MKLTCRSKFAMASFDVVGTFFLALHDERKLLLEYEQRRAKTT